MTEYKNGMPLAEAARALAPRWLGGEFEEAQNFLNNGAEPFALQTDDGGWPTLLSHLVEKVLPAVRAPLDILVLMQEDLLAKLRSGKFIALGFRLPRNPSDPAVNVPADLFESRYVDWHNSAIKGAGLNFANVRVVRAPKTIRATEGDPNPPAKPSNLAASGENPSRPGRRSMTLLIEEAYSALDALGLIEQHAKKRAIAGAIKRWIKRQYPGTPLPGDETIRRYIVRRQSSKLNFEDGFEE